MPPQLYLLKILFYLDSRTIFAGREMHVELAGEPETVQNLVDKLKEFEKMMAEMNESAKKPKLSKAADN